MNAVLLSRFARELRGALRWHYLDEPRWFSPVLALPFDRARHHLVVVLETPGPFCFLHDASPFAGATAPARFAALTGARVEEVSVEGRVLRIDVVTRRTEEKIALRVALFGANGSASLSRGESVLETLGRVRLPREDRGETGSAHAAATEGRFELVTWRSVASAAPRSLETASPHEGLHSLGTFDDARTACSHAGALVLDEAQALILHRVARPARRKLDALRRLARNLESDLEEASAHRDERREAEALAAYQTTVRPGARFADVPDLYDADRTLHIELDPTLPVHVQVEKRFRRATKLEKAVTHLARRLELVRREHTELDAALGMLGEIHSFGEALKLYEVMRAKFGIALDRTAGERGASPRKAAREKTYRSFDLDARWFVLVGRSNQENDEITFRVASPGDWWFHAEGVPGSHVVLRARGGSDAPPARVIQQAASIAAHFSRARHSALVPVIYTRRRYVRKFRGAAPGQVKCERETMLMVPPALPAGGAE
jgi:hypothetical protein